MDYLKPFLSNFPYFIEVPPASLPIELPFLKEWLKIDVSDASQDVLLTLLIESARNCFESFTNRTLINTTFRTLRNFFVPAIELRRSPFSSLVSFKYTVNDALVDVDSSLFYIMQAKDYSKIIQQEDQDYPANGDDILQGIEIQFVAGYGITEADIPSDIKLALLNHITALYENRGDCDCASVSKSIPNATMTVYRKYKILEAI